MAYEVYVKSYVNDTDFVREFTETTSDSTEVDTIKATIQTRHVVLLDTDSRNIVESREV